MDEIIIQSLNFQVSQKDFFIRLLVAIGVGFLIGLEREYSAISRKEDRFAGSRTFILVSLLGFVSTLLFYILTPWIFVGSILTLVIIIGISYWITASKGDIGGTTEFSALLAFFLGILTFLGHIELSLIITVIIVALLSIKVTLHTMIGKITQEEMYDFIRFVVTALLIFPFLPDINIGPYNVINPKEIGWVVVLTSGFGFLGYLLMKFMGPGRGILLSGIIGGLVSSTMTTWIFAKKSKESSALSFNCAAAIIAASSVMVVRVIVWVLIFNSSLAPGLLVPVGIILLASVGSTLYFYKKQSKTSSINSEENKGRPLNLQSALVFAMIYTLIIVLVSYTNDYLGEGGIYLSSAIAGLTDIDAITISVSKLSKESLAILYAQNAIIIATICNTLVKIGIALWAGSSELKKYLLVGYGLIFIAGMVGIFVLNYIL